MAAKNKSNPAVESEITIEQRKANCLARINELKAKKPDNWKRDVRRLLYRLAYLDDPFGEHEDHGDERRGRKIHRSDGCPSYDRMGDNSWP